VADLHAAFADPAVAAVMTVIGGYNSNELLPSLDWELIRANPNLSTLSLLQGTPYMPPLAGLPVLANVDIGHTSPMATLPIGGQITMSAEPNDPHLVLTRH